MVKPRKSRVLRASSDTKTEKKLKVLRAYCERLKTEMLEGRERGSILKSSKRGGRDGVGRDAMGIALVLHASQTLEFFAGGQSIAQARRQSGSEKEDADGVMKIVEKIYDIADDVRKNLVTCIEGTTMLLRTVPDLGVILSLLWVSRTATVIALIANGVGKLLASRLKRFTSEEGVNAIIYFYAIPFIDPIQ
jgi:hypothetical protein